MNTQTIKFAYRNLVAILATEIIRDFKLRRQKDIRDKSDSICDYIESCLKSCLKYLLLQHIEIIYCQILKKLYQILPNIELVK